jgi:hypothetical protein
MQIPLQISYFHKHPSMPGRPYLCKALRCRLTPDFSSYQWSRPTRARLIHPSGETFGLSFCPKSGRKSGGSARAREWFSEGRMTMTSEAHRPCLIRPITGHSQNKKNSVDLSHTLPLHRIPLPNGRPPLPPSIFPKPNHGREASSVDWVERRSPEWVWPGVCLAHPF